MVRKIAKAKSLEIVDQLIFGVLSGEISDKQDCKVGSAPKTKLT